MDVLRNEKVIGYSNYYFEHNEDIMTVENNTKFVEIEFRSYNKKAPLDFQMIEMYNSKGDKWQWNVNKINKRYEKKRIFSIESYHARVDSKVNDLIRFFNQRYKKFKSFSSRFHPALSAEVAVASTSASSRFVRCVFLDSVSTRIEPWKTSWMIDEPGRFVPPRSRWSWLRSQPCVVTGRGDGVAAASSHEDAVAAM